MSIKSGGSTLSILFKIDLFATMADKEKKNLFDEEEDDDDDDDEKEEDHEE